MYYYVGSLIKYTDDYLFLVYRYHLVLMAILFLFFDSCGNDA
jgi:hypothetical protein